MLKHKASSWIPPPPTPPLQSLSPAQLEAFGPDNAELVTSQQRAALGDEQLAALERASTGSYEQPNTSDDSSGEGGHPPRLTLSHCKDNVCIWMLSFSSQGLHQRVRRASRPSRSRCSFS